MQQVTEFKFSPRNGGPLKGSDGLTAAGFRSDYPTLPWDFNPWTGNARQIADVKSDPTGLLIVPPNELVYATGDRSPVSFCHIHPGAGFRGPVCPACAIPSKAASAPQKPARNLAVENAGLVAIIVEMSKLLADAIRERDAA